MQQPSKQGGERQPPSQTAAKVSKARTPLCVQEMGALPAGEEWESLSLSGGRSKQVPHTPSRYLLTTGGPPFPKAGVQTSN